MQEWQKRENQRYLKMFDTDAVVDHQGIVRWKSNGSIPPKDIMQVWADANKSFNHQECLAVSAQETFAFLQAYRDAEASAPVNPEAEAERLFEMRAAFGPGQTIVNAFTGKTYKT